MLLRCQNLSTLVPTTGICMYLEICYLCLVQTQVDEQPGSTSTTDDPVDPMIDKGPINPP